VGTIATYSPAIATESIISALGHPAPETPSPERHKSQGGSAVEKGLKKTTRHRGPPQINILTLATPEAR
jgi:hypothetical protein